MKNVNPKGNKAVTTKIESIVTEETQAETETESMEEMQETETTVQVQETEESVQEQTLMEEPDVAMAQTTNKTSPLPFVAGGIVVVLAGAGAAVFYFRKKGTNE